MIPSLFPGEPGLAPRPTHAAARWIALIALVALVGCSSGPPAAAPETPPVPPVPPVAPAAEPLVPADSGAASMVAPGVTRHTLFRARGPWAIHVLDVDLDSCWMPAVLKRDSTAVGRATTSALLAKGRLSGDTVAAVNGDFFLFAPPGVPTGAHVDDGRVITGPAARPVVAVDSAGRTRLVRLAIAGSAVARGDTMRVTEWNHLPVTTLGVFDQRWGIWTDTTTGTLQVVVARDRRVVRTMRGAVRANIPRGGWVLAAPAGAPPAVTRWLGALRVGDSVRVRTALRPFHPREAIGGFPLLVRDSAVARVLDSAHVQALSAARHPRTAVGIGRDGRRLVLVVVDGRQPGYSAGMTLPELARLMLEVGVRDAINLDGGGSSTMAVRRVGGEIELVNRPSDAAGERPVANALGVVRGCRGA